MQLLKPTHSYLSNFAAFCRTGVLEEIPGIHKTNIQHYRKLVLNVIDDTLQNAYPITYQLLSNDEWNLLVKDFFAMHNCQTPQVWYMPKEFYTWIIETKHKILDSYIFLDELLWFEWIELEIFMMEDEVVTHSKLGDLLFSKLVLNPEHRLLCFNFPIHKKNCNQITIANKGKYFLVASRNSKGDVLFNELSPALVRVIEYLEAQPLSMIELFHKIQGEFQVTLSEIDQKSIINFCESAYQQDLIIGFKN